jgi:hypothetical protein
MFDADKNGFIDVDELSTIMEKLGQTFNINQLKASNFKIFTFIFFLFLSGDDNVCGHEQGWEHFF